MGLLQAIVEPGTPVYLDVHAHASLWEGAISAGAVAVRFAHNDMKALQTAMERHGPGVVAVDAVYSTNGALCELAACGQICRDNDCLLVVDESHSLGTHGAHGEGLVAALGLTGQVHFVTASLAKSYACRAGFIACPRTAKLFMMMTSRPAILSSSLMPIDVVAIDAVHSLLLQSDDRRERLRRTSRQLRAELGARGYPAANGTEQIIGLEVGDEQAVMAVRDELEAHGVFGSIFCPPATGARHCLIRLSVNTALSDAQLERVVEVFQARKHRLRPERWIGHRRPGAAAGPRDAVNGNVPS